MRTMKKTFSVLVALLMGMCLASKRAIAQPLVGQIVPIAIYVDLDLAFGLTYDSKNDLMWYSEGQLDLTGEIHSFMPYKNYSEGQRNSFFNQSLGIQIINPTQAQEDVAGITPSPGAALGFDEASGRLVSSPLNSPTLVAAEPFTFNNQDPNFRPGHAPIGGLIDGLDIEPDSTWYSPDIEDIYRNGNLFADNTNPDQTTLPEWLGLGSPTAEGWSGVEQVDDNVFAVAVHERGNQGLTRTIVRFDLNGRLVSFDPDGDPRATRWEDLAYDGEFLYAADARGDADSNEIIGDVYVFGVTGGLDPTSVPEPTSELGLLAFGSIGAGSTFLRRRKKQQD